MKKPGDRVEMLVVGGTNQAKMPDRESTTALPRGRYGQANRKVRRKGKPKLCSVGDVIKPIEVPVGGMSKRCPVGGTVKLIRMPDTGGIPKRCSRAEERKQGKRRDRKWKTVQPTN